MEFAERRCSAREERAHTFEDFLAYLQYGKYVEELTDVDASFNEAVNRFCDSIGPLCEEDDFNIGDWVKYIPTPRRKLY